MSSEISVTTDAVVLSPTPAGELFVLLVTRKNEPFQGQLALPGGFLEPNETLAECARRELSEETGLDVAPFFQLNERSDPSRDPRGRVISFPFVFLTKDLPEVTGADDAEKAEWVNVDSLDPEDPNSPKLAFDHLDIIGEGVGAVIVDLMSRQRPSELSLPPNATL